MALGRGNLDEGQAQLAQGFGQFVFLLADSAWRLAAGRAYDVEVDIDGDVFTGASRVVDGQTIAIENVSAKVMKSMYHGDRATISIADASWDLNLTNAARAFDVAAGLDSTTAN